MQTRPIWIIAAGLLACGNAHATPPGEWVLNRKNLTAEQARLAEALLSEVQASLPPKMAAELPSRLRIEFTALDGNSELNPNCDGKGGGFLAGRFSSIPSPRISLHIGFLGELLRDPPRTFPCAHGDFRSLAKSTLFHELLHAYDQGDRLSRAERSQLDRCEQQAQGDQTAFVPAPDCARLRLRDTPLSRRPQFLKLAGWKDGLLGVNPKNTLRARHPRPYEMSAPEEFLAVNFEYFMNDPEYRCRRPALFRFFRDLFEFEPAARAKCEAMHGVHFTDSEEPVSLDPKRIYQVHYLEASPGSEAGSGFGHSMLRLIVCGPERAVPGPECLRDISHHVVVSYRANLQDFMLSIMKGLFGKYASRPFILKMTDVIQEYNYSELRDLRSVPLRLSAPQKEQLIEELVEQYWAYSGRYYFLTNNCATETRDLVASVMPDEHPIHLREPLKPTSVLRHLEESGVADTSSLNDPMASANGLVFPSTRKADLANAFRRVKPHLPPEFVSLEDYILKASAARRGILIKRMAPSAAMEKSLAAALIQLEVQALKNAEADVQRRLMTLLEAEKNITAGEQRAMVRRLKALLAKAQPWEKLAPGAGYGIPTCAERCGARLNGPANQPRLEELMAGLLRSLLPGFDDELIASERNLEILYAHIRRI